MAKQTDSPAPTKQVPSIGRVVHFVLADGLNPGKHRMAFVADVWDQECVELQVVTTPNDGEQYASGLYWASTVHQDEAGAPGTWHWPEFVAPVPVEEPAAAADAGGALNTAQ